MIVKFNLHLPKNFEYLKSMKSTNVLYNAVSMFIALSFISVMFSCKQTTNPTDVVNNPATASRQKVDTANVPVFSFTEELHEFGKIAQGEKVSYNFKFKNTGKSDLVISSATGSCGCTVPEYPKKPVTPGAEATINVIFNSEGKEGNIKKTVTLVANTIPNVKILTITGEVIVATKK